MSECNNNYLDRPKWTDKNKDLVTGEARQECRDFINRLDDLKLSCMVAEPELFTLGVFCRNHNLSYNSLIFYIKKYKKEFKGLDFLDSNEKSKIKIKIIDEESFIESLKQYLQKHRRCKTEFADKILAL